MTVFKKSLREACVDTFIGFWTTIPINYFGMMVVFYYQMSTFWATVFLTAIFTVFAIIRKTLVRMTFYKRYGG